MYCVAKKTLARQYNTKSGISKPYEWICVEGAPCIIINSDESKYTLNCFTSSSLREFDVTIEEYNELFYPLYPDQNNFLTVSKYPMPINCDEFKNRDAVVNFDKQIKELMKSSDISETTVKIFEDKIFQIIQSQGAPYITIKEFHQYNAGEMELSSHKRFGHEIFNRNCRWCPPIDIDYNEYITTPSYPAPLGIRPKDFCLPSDLIITMKELINQIVNFENFPEADYLLFKNKFAFIEKKESICKYCGDALDYSKYSSVYKSSTNFMEICHRNPTVNFTKDNMYWGHCDCNRKQGGYSENDVMCDGIKLMFLNGKINKKDYEVLLDKLKS